MSAPGTPALSAYVNAVKGHVLSADKRELSVVLEAKHVGELSIVLSTEQVEQLATIIDQVKLQLPAESADKDKLKVTVPKNWFVAADLNRDLVLLAFNRQSAAQTAYALEPASAKGLVKSLVKYADLVLQKKQSARTSDPSGEQQ
jgi:hypothetical protein